MKRLKIGLMVLVLLLSSMGHRPAWAASTLIRLVGYDEASQRLVIFADGPLTPRSFNLVSPHRWVVDFPNARYRGATVKIPAIPNSPVTGVRVSQWNMGTVRMVFDLNENASFPHDLLKISDQNYRLAFHFDTKRASAPAADPKTSTPKPQAQTAQEPARDAGREAKDPPAKAPATGQVTGFAVEGDRLVLRTTRPITSAQKTQVEKTGRTVYDFPGMTLSPKLKNRTLKAPKLGIREARLLQQGSAVRLIVDAPGRDQQWKDEALADRWALGPAQSPASKAPSYAQAPIEDGESGLSLKRVGKGWQLTLTANGKVSYRLVGPSRRDRLVFDIVGGSVDLPRDSLYVDNGLIARVRSIPQSDDTLRVVVELDQDVGFAVRSTSSQRSVVIAMAPPGTPIPAGPPMAAATPAPKPVEATPTPAVPKAVDAALDHQDERKRVTIDPGHGGEDPGGIGSHGTEEKDVTLSLALKLQKLMRDSGMEVQMTRTDDMQIQLRPRVAMGDDFDSDVFISIHTNAIANPKINGIETYYFTPQSLPLAKAVHRHLVTKLGRPDRGIRRNNFVVVKYNKMPACLVEIGYLTNPTEEKLLKSAAYQQKAAEAILAGVQDYFKSKAYRQ
ncbi:N-acetylmuramoyl-L-alanine amidase LytC precursor [compost metagenome]